MKILTKKYRVVVVGGAANENWETMQTGRTYVPDDRVCFEANTVEELQDLAEKKGVELVSKPSEESGATPVIVMKPLEILSRMTPAEEASLTMSTDLSVSVVRQRLIAASEVRSDDPRTAEGAAVLVNKGILTAERAKVIFPLEA